MMSWFRSWAECFRARRADSHLDFEAELLSRAAQRKANLLRQANRLDDEGLHQVAAELKSCAEMLTFERPLSSLLLPTIHAAPPSSNTSSNGTAPKPTSRSATK